MRTIAESTEEEDDFPRSQSLDYPFEKQFSSPDRLQHASPDSPQPQPRKFSELEKPNISLH
jgi:hypothetical protein